MDTSCGSVIPVMTFNGIEGVRFSESPDLTGTFDTYFQLVLSMTCSADQSCYYISIEYSVDQGQTWRNWDAPSPQFPHYNPMEDLPPQWPGPHYSSDIYRREELITLPLPPLAISRSFRLRLIQHNPPSDNSKTWAIPHLYLGTSCANRCNNRGLCVTGQCQCHSGWMGISCNASVVPLPKFLLEEFNADPNSNGRWKKVVGGSLSEDCDAAGVGKTLFFDGVSGMKSIFHAC